MRADGPISIADDALCSLIARAPGAAFSWAAEGSFALRRFGHRHVRDGTAVAHPRQGRTRATVVVRYFGDRLAQDVRALRSTVHAGSTWSGEGPAIPSSADHLTGDAGRRCALCIRDVHRRP